jgi:uncharacterized protein (TIGR02231 family)
MTSLLRFISIQTLILSSTISFTIALYAETDTASAISSVKLYRNQAVITRTCEIKLNKGANNLVFNELPLSLLDNTLQVNIDSAASKLISVNINEILSAKSIIPTISEIESQIKKLRLEDSVLVDNISALNIQEKFILSMNECAAANAFKENVLASPNTKNWEVTISWFSTKLNKIFEEKRSIAGQREEIAKKIQNLEFELAKITGDNPPKLTQPSHIKTKQVTATIFSPSDNKALINISYSVDRTSWKMSYDMRADTNKKDVTLSVYSNILQRSGENWNNVLITLSSGTLTRGIGSPVCYPWILQEQEKYRPMNLSKSARAESEYFQGSGWNAEMSDDYDYAPTISDTGVNIEVQLPNKQTVISSDKYQKQLIGEYVLDQKSIKSFYYELVPTFSETAYLKADITNSTPLHWLAGEAQTFFNNDYAGSMNIPYTPISSSQNMILGVEDKIVGRKELVKKYEDTKGILGNNRRIQYSYRITVENKTSSSKEIMLTDALPISRNEKIKVEISKPSLAFHKDAEFEKTEDYANGIRKWKLNLEGGQKLAITYDLSITFDKSIAIEGMR